MHSATFLVAGLVLIALQDPMTDAAMLRRAQQLALPVANHERLQRLAGEWQLEVRSTVGDAEQTTRGTVVGKAMLGGRYLMLDYRLSFAGRDVAAVQMLGFDTLHQVYTSSYRDDASTWSVEASGTEDVNAPDLLQLRGTLTDARDPSGRAFRLEIDLQQQNAVAVRLFDTIAGNEVRVQSQTWTRR